MTDIEAYFETIDTITEHLDIDSTIIHKLYNSNDTDRYFKIEDFFRQHNIYVPHISIFKRFSDMNSSEYYKNILIKKALNL